MVGNGQIVGDGVPPIVAASDIGFDAISETALIVKAITDAGRGH
jgi:hypothetical protein